MRVLVVATLVAGCSFRSPILPDGDLGEIPDSVDARSCVAWDAPNVLSCDPAIGSPTPIDIAAGDYTLDTDAGTLTGSGAPLSLPGAIVAQAGGPAVRVVNTTRLTIMAGANITVTGSHALVVVVHGDATIDGVVDGSAVVHGSLSTPGPGGDDGTLCGTSSGQAGAPSTGAAGGAGGGGGGAFGGNGGNGGDGNGGGHGAKGAPGLVGGVASILPLRGGCAGGLGGADAGATPGGPAGSGGGAIEITALGTVTIAGSIRAGGGGGLAASLVRGGGGGGGSGGAIILDGDVVTIASTAFVCANGGGGGEGGQLAMTSSDGEPGTCSDTTFALGGAGQVDGGDGGAGSVEGQLDGGAAKNGGAGAGGGGGGGGVGRVRVRGRTSRALDGQVSPNPPMS